MKCALTLILRIKLTGYENDEDVVKWLMEDLKCRINEVEVPIFGGEGEKDLNAKCVRVTSQHYSQGEEKDMMQYTIRTDQTFDCGDGDYGDYPFDTITAQFRFELSHFNIDGKNYRFDLYQQPNWLSFKPNCDQLPLNGINYEDCEFFETIVENKPHKKDGKSIKLMYYPGLIVSLKLPRSPQQPMLKYFVPAVIISVFITSANVIPELADMLAVESLSLLTYIEMYNSIREELPPTLEVTSIERLILFYILYSIVPVIDTTVGPNALNGINAYILWAVITFGVMAWYGYRFVKQRAIAMDRDPPAQEKVKGDKNAPDKNWKIPDDVDAKAKAAKEAKANK